MVNTIPTVQLLTSLSQKDTARCSYEGDIVCPSMDHLFETYQRDAVLIRTVGLVSIYYEYYQIHWEKIEALQSIFVKLECALHIIPTGR